MKEKRYLRANKLIEKSCARVDRFSFNGMEKSPEISSGHQTTLHRELDTRTGRWWSVDPEAAKYYSWSPYCQSMNTPILAYDTYGNTVTFPNPESEAYFGQIYAGASESKKVELDRLIASDVIYRINVNASLEVMRNPNELGHTLYNFGEKMVDVNVLGGQSDAVTISALGDELTHSYQYDIGEIGFTEGVDGKSYAFSYDMFDEIQSKRGGILAIEGVNKRREGALGMIYGLIGIDNKELTKIGNLKLPDDDQEFKIADETGGGTGMGHNIQMYNFFGKRKEAYLNQFDIKKPDESRMAKDIDQVFMSGQIRFGTIKSYIYRRKFSGKYETKHQTK